MKYSIIEAMFFGQRGQAECIGINENYKKILVDIDKLSEEFLKELTKEQREKFNEIINMHFGMEAESATEHYKEGFKVGLLVGVESCSG